MRNFAHLERELFFCSSSPATSGFLPIETISRFFPQTQTGKLLSHTQSVSRSRKAFLTMRSSNEWKVRMQILPPFFNFLASPLTVSDNLSNSPLTSMRIA